MGRRESLYFTFFSIFIFLLLLIFYSMLFLRGHFLRVGSICSDNIHEFLKVNVYIVVILSKR